MYHSSKELPEWLKAVLIGFGIFFLAGGVFTLVLLI